MTELLITAVIIVGAIGIVGSVWAIRYTNRRFHEIRNQNRELADRVDANLRRGTRL